MAEFARCPECDGAAELMWTTRARQRSEGLRYRCITPSCGAMFTTGGVAGIHGDGIIGKIDTPGTAQSLSNPEPEPAPVTCECGAGDGAPHRPGRGPCINGARGWRELWSCA